MPTGAAALNKKKQQIFLAACQSIFLWVYDPIVWLKSSELLQILGSLYGAICEPAILGVDLTGALPLLKRAAGPGIRGAPVSESLCCGAWLDVNAMRGTKSALMKKLCSFEEQRK